MPYQDKYYFCSQEDIAKSLLAEFNLGCTETDKDHNYRVYVTTYLGYGGNIARTRYQELLVNTTTLLPATVMGTRASGNITVARKYDMLFNCPSDASGGDGGGLPGDVEDGGYCR